MEATNPKNCDQSNLKVNDVCEVKWTDRKVYKAMIVTLGKASSKLCIEETIFTGGHVKMEAKLAEMAEGKPELKAQVSCLQTQVTYLLRIRAQTESTDSSTESSSQCGSGTRLFSVVLHFYRLYMHLRVGSTIMHINHTEMCRLLIFFFTCRMLAGGS